MGGEYPGRASEESVSMGWVDLTGLLLDRTCQSRGSATGDVTVMASGDIWQMWVVALFGFMLGFMIR
jgi:hypothetical protein